MEIAYCIALLCCGCFSGFGLELVVGPVLLCFIVQFWTFFDWFFFIGKDFEVVTWNNLN